METTCDLESEGGILTALGASGREAFAELERWLYFQSSSRKGLQEVEVEAEQRGRDILRMMMQTHICSRGSGDIGPVLTVCAEGEERGIIYSHKRLRARRLITVFGEVTVVRMEYGAPGHSSIYPLDAALALPARAYSYEIQRRLAKAVIRGPFDEAIASVAEATGVCVPKRTAQSIVQEASADFESFYAQRTAALNAESGPLLVASVDGKGVPMVKPKQAEKIVRLGRGEKRNKKRMATVAAVFTQQPNMRTPEDVVESLFGETGADKKRRPYAKPEQKRIWASILSSKDEFIADVRREVLRRDPGHGKTWIVVTDGERALQQKTTATLGDVTLVLDLLHVLEKLWAASYVFHPEGSPEAQAFVRQRILRILQGGVSQVVKGLRQMVTKRKLRGERRKQLCQVAGYYYRNRARMRYNVYLENGFPIASGSVEGACKNLVKDRMERSGMRWTPEMAEAVLRLRALYLSGHFDEYWDYHVKQDQKRLYPSDPSVIH